MQWTSLTLNRGIVYAFYAAVIVTRLLGGISYSYDFKRKSFVLQTKYQQIYCAFVHLVYIILLPIALLSPYMQEATYEQKPFYLLLNCLITMLRLPALMLTLVGTWLGRKNMFTLIYRFEAIRLRYFHTLTEAQRRKILKRNDILIIMKLITATSLIFTFYVRLFMWVELPSTQFILFSIYFGILEVLCLFKMNFFFIGMCYANCILRYIYMELCVYSTGEVKFPRLHDLIGIYMEMRRLVRDLTNIFQWEILSITLAGMVALISLFFNYIVWWQKVNHEDVSIYTYGFLLLGLKASLVNLSEVVLIAYICCNTIKCAKRIRDVLLVLHIEPKYLRDEVIQKELNFLALQLSCNLPWVNVCGFFNLTKSMAFAFLRGTMMYLIILLQCYYKF